MLGYGLIIREMIGDTILEQIGIGELADGLYFFVCKTTEGERVIKRFTKIY